METHAGTGCSNIPARCVVIGPACKYLSGRALVIVEFLEGLGVGGGDECEIRVLNTDGLVTALSSTCPGRRWL
jgi:hypothetical protein